MNNSKRFQCQCNKPAAAASQPLLPATALVILFFLLSCLPASGQPKPIIVLSQAGLQDGLSYDAWVGFVDKGKLTTTQQQVIREDLEKNFNPRALARRKAKRTFPGLFDERDFPLCRQYKEGVAQTGAAIRVESRWLNGVTILASKKQIEQVLRLPYVKEVTDFHEHKPRQQSDNETGSRPGDSSRPLDKPGFYGRAQLQVTQLGLDKLHKAGYTGKGMLVAVIDCGFNLSHKAFNHPRYPLRVKAQWDFVENDGDVIPRPGLHPTNYEHGSAVLGIIAAYAPGEFIGSAYGADFILCNAEDGEIEYYLEERWFAAALEFAEAHGADVLTSSLVLYGGYRQEQTDGQTSIMTKALNIAAGNGIACFIGGGNSGHDEDPAVSHLMAPGDAAQVITVGAVDLKGEIARFSSDGPSAAGLLKPEVLALGAFTATISTADKNEYQGSFGTSVATPLMAGAATCLLQAHPQWKVAELRQALFHSGDFYRLHGKPDPLFIHGYGIPDVFLAAGLAVEKSRQ